MPTPVDEIEIEKLDIPQRLDLIGRIWDSMLLEDLPIPDWHAKELDCRIVDADANPDAAIPLDKVMARLRQRP